MCFSQREEREYVVFVFCSLLIVVKSRAQANGEAEEKKTLPTDRPTDTHRHWRGSLFSWEGAEKGGANLRGEATKPRARP